MRSQDEIMPRIHAVPNAECAWFVQPPEGSSQPSRQLQIYCRTCNHEIAVNLTALDFVSESGERLQTTSKLAECPGCATMNVRYFSWENEFGDEDTPPFAAVPTALVGGDNTGDALWLPEVMEDESVEPQGEKVIGTLFVVAQFLRLSSSDALRVGGRAARKSPNYIVTSVKTQIGITQ